MIFRKVVEERVKQMVITRWTQDSLTLRNYT